MFGGSFILLGILIPVVSLIATLVLRWLANRPEPPDSSPITAEELYRERPEFILADFSYEYLDPLLESIEDTLDTGFSSSQRNSLVERVSNLQIDQTTYAIFPVQYNGAPSDLLMHFMRLDADIVRCRIEASSTIVERLRILVSGIPQKTNV